MLQSLSSVFMRSGKTQLLGFKPINTIVLWCYNFPRCQSKEDTAT